MDKTQVRVRNMVCKDCEQDIRNAISELSKFHNKQFEKEPYPANDEIRRVTLLTLMMLQDKLGMERTIIVNP